jgi:hypothetical protein
MLKRANAAKYCELTPQQFDAEVYAGRLPGAVAMSGGPRWDRAALDASLDEMSSGANDWRKDQPGLAA